LGLQADWRCYAFFHSAWPKYTPLQRSRRFPVFEGWRAGACNDRGLDPSKLDTPMRRRLVPLCAHYLLHKKRGKEPFDSVGVSFEERGAAGADQLACRHATAGMRQSAGLMANYVYDIADLEQNHESYARSGRIVRSRGVQTLANQAGRRNH
jgi:hypothetical protein